MLAGFAGFHFAKINYARVRFVGKFFEDVGADEVVAAEKNEDWEAAMRKSMAGLRSFPK